MKIPNDWHRECVDRLAAAGYKTNFKRHGDGSFRAAALQALRVAAQHERWSCWRDIIMRQPIVFPDAWRLDRRGLEIVEVVGSNGAGGPPHRVFAKYERLLSAFDAVALDVLLTAITRFGTVHLSGLETVAQLWIDDARRH